ncbi:MAG: hypothetical protein AAB152_09350 [Candidatus Coatesbacteria bacterium]
MSPAARPPRPPAIAPSASPGNPGSVVPPVGFWALALFSGYLYLGAMGGTFFRMARDNDDLVRMSFLLAAGAALSFVLVRRGARLPLSLVLPALGYALACFYSSFDTVNPGDSLKDFLKIGTYLMAFLTIASVAAAPLDPAGRDRRRFVAYVCLLAGLALGFLHTPPQPSKVQVYGLGALLLAVAAFRPGSALTTRQRLGVAFAGGVLLIGLVIADPAAIGTQLAFRLWSTPQVLASLGTTLLCAVGFAVFIEAVTVRAAMLRGLVVLIVISCAIGLMQFYGIEALRAWDPRQPYDTWISGFLADAVAPFTIGVYRFDASTNRSYLVLPRILGIYGNPNFFMPFLMQFIPLTIACAVLTPGRRWFWIGATALLTLNMGLTETAGGWYALVALAPVFGTLLGWVAGPLPETGHRALGIRVAITGGIVLVFSGCLLLTKDLILPLFFISLAGLLGLLGWGATRLRHDRIGRAALATVLGGGAILVAVGAGLYATGYKGESLNERGLKSLLALEMWRGMPLTTPHAPLTGVGINGYKSWYPVIQQAVRLPRGIPFEKLGSSFTQENRTHDDWLQMLAETGAIGTGMFIWLLASIFAGALRRLRDDHGLDAGDRAAICGLTGSLGIILIYMVPNFPFHIVSSAATWWVMAGLLASYQSEWVLARRRAGPVAALPPFGGAWRPALEAAGLGSVAVIGVLSVQLFTGTLTYKHAEDAWKNPRQPDPVRGMALYQRAIDLDPFNAQYAYDYGALCYNNISRDAALAPRAKRLFERSRALGFESDDLEYALGQLAELSGDYLQALVRFDRATGLNERHEYARQGRIRMKLRPYPAFLATLDPRHTQLVAARRMARDILRKDPDNYAVLSVLGRLSVTAFHDYPAAVACMKRACELVPNEPEFWQWYGYACAAAGDLGTSVIALRRSLVLNQGSQDVRRALGQIEDLVRRQKEQTTRPTSPPTPRKTG